MGKRYIRLLVQRLSCNAKNPVCAGEKHEKLSFQYHFSPPENYSSSTAWFGRKFQHLC